MNPAAAKAADPAGFSLAIKYAAYVLKAAAQIAMTSPEPELALHLASHAAIAT